MEASHFKKAGIVTILVVVVSIGCREFYLRSKGVSCSYDDNEALWAYKRAQIYKEPDATFFIGSSRIKFDIDIETREQETGQKALQLALVGTSPQLVFKDLADDNKFNGRLIIDGTEFILFSRDPADHESAKKTIEYYKKITPAQEASFSIDYLLQSKFAFPESKKFSLKGLCDQLRVPERKGVFVFKGFPIGFEPTNSDRQNVMSEDFVRDTSRHRELKNARIKFGAVSSAPGIKGDSLQHILKDIKNSIDKITGRGGQVLFIRPPSSGEAREAEKIAYPREQYRDKLLQYTNTPGIYFEDYPEIAAFECPEWSHLSRQQAVVYTTKIIEIIQTKKGRVFPRKTLTAYNQT